MTDRSNQQVQQVQESKRSGSAHRNGKFEQFFFRACERKLRHILKNDGAMAARAYVQENGLSDLLHKIAEEGTLAGSVAREALGGR